MSRSDERTADDNETSVEASTGETLAICLFVGAVGLARWWARSRVSSVDRSRSGPAASMTGPSTSAYFSAMRVNESARQAAMNGYLAPPPPPPLPGEPWRPPPP